MDADSLERIADSLAGNRRHGRLSDIGLRDIATAGEAYEIQDEALEAYGSDPVGFAITGSSVAARRSLGLDAPVFTLLPGDACLVHDRPVRLPPGLIGAQCELAFTFLRAFPEAGEPLTRERIVSAILGCQPAIGLLARRIRHPVAGDHAATADFALHAATICGPFAPPADFLALDTVEVSALLNGARLAGNPLLGQPLDALLWLAGALLRRGRRINAGDIVSTGACTTILQVLAGQQLVADFGPLGFARCRFE